MDNAFENDPILVEVEREGFVESAHRARVAITNPDGSLAHALGDAHALIYPRSTSKPFQVVGMLGLGLDLQGELLALASASHSGEDFHVDGVRRILSLSALDENALQTPADYPLDDYFKLEWVRAGRAQAPVVMNCSGKHAAMIRTAVVAGHAVESYRSPQHPVQRAILEAISDMAGEPAAAETTDGCGAPLYATSLAGLARGFGRLAAADTGPEKDVADAIRAHPEWTSGTRRDEAALHRAIPGLVGKAGAEAVYGVGLPDGRGIALKISDGFYRARPVLMAGILQQLGFANDVLADQASAPVLGHGERIGEIRPHWAALADLR